MRIARCTPCVVSRLYLPIHRYNVTEILTTYDPITLAEMKGIRLMNRTDTKFVTTVGQLEKLLAMAGDMYYAQDIFGKRMAPYYTVYYDTPEWDMYNVHHTGRANRQKLRIRSYVDSGHNFLEIKTKNNHKRTKKRRVLVEGFDPSQPRYDLIFDSCRPEGEAVCTDFMKQYLGYDPQMLHEQLENRFDRITLVNKQKTERLTIDTNLRFHNLTTGSDASFDGIAIIELKRDGLAYSPILEMLRRLRIKPLGFSKYCMGSALTNERLRVNRFLPRLRAIDKLRAVDCGAAPLLDRLNY